MNGGSEARYRMFEFAAKMALYLGTLGLVIGFIVLERDASRTVKQAQASLLQLQIDEEATSSNLNAALIQLGLTLDQTQQASREQRIYWKQTSESTRDTMHDLQVVAANAIIFLNQLDSNVNDNLLPQATNSLVAMEVHVNTLTTTIAASMGRLLDQSEPVMSNLAVASKGAADAMSSPELTEAVKRIDQAALEANESLVNVHRITSDVAEAVHRETRPASFLMRTFQTALGLTVKAATIAAGVK